MTRLEFIRELDALLTGLPDKERLDILADYTEHFLIGIESGKNEHEIAEALGSPKVIAREIMAGFHIYKAQSDTSLKNMVRAIFATVSLGFVNLVFVLGPFLCLLATLFFLYVAAGALIFSPIPFVAGSGKPDTIDELVFLVSGSLSAFGLGLVMAVGMIYLTKWLYRLFLRYLHFNLRLIRGK